MDRRHGRNIWERKILTKIFDPVKEIEEIDSTLSSMRDIITQV